MIFIVARAMRYNWIIDRRAHKRWLILGGPLDQDFQRAHGFRVVLIRFFPALFRAQAHQA